jgi:hypothetical protein
MTFHDSSITDIRACICKINTDPTPNLGTSNKTFEMMETAASKQLPQGDCVAVHPAIAPEKSDFKHDPEVPIDANSQYTSGLKFVLLTIGLMAVVLVLALDNYIIGQQPSILAS